jgi:hypothetical protein
MKGMSGLGVPLVLRLILGACGDGKQSAIEGKLVDGKGVPVAGVRITASQVHPIKGYEQFETVTGADGTFRLGGLFPSSQYVLKPWSDKWTSKTAVRLKSAPHGKTAVRRRPMTIAQAFSKNNGTLISDLATGATRFTVSSDGAISDAQTGLEWVVGPDRDTDYAQAEQWVRACNVAGGGWRMPTHEELRTLYQEGAGERNMDPVFKTTGRWVLAEPRDLSSAWLLDFDNGRECWSDVYSAGNDRVFGVRSRLRR